MARPTRNHKGDVYDPFVGSGTTLIAAQKLGRRCFAIDIEPAYCDVTVERWRKLTGEEPQRIPMAVAA
jgi:DNA modification methylase